MGRELHGNEHLRGASGEPAAPAGALRASAATYELHAERGLVWIHLTGEPSATDSVALLEQLRADSRFHAGMNAVIDRRRLVDPPDAKYTGAVLEQIAAHWPSTMIHRWAILTSPGAQFGMARMLALRADVRGLVMEAFTDEGEALAWLAENDTGAQPAT